MRVFPRRFALLTCSLVALLVLPVGSAAAPSTADPVASYMLQIDGRAAAAEYGAARRGGASRAEAARAARARRQANARRQGAVIAELRTRGLGRRVQYQVATAFNGIAMRARRSEVAGMRRVGGVVAVRPIPAAEAENAAAVPFTGTQHVWTAPPGLTGEDVSIGVIDTGVDYTHTGFGGTGDAADKAAADDAAANPATPVSPRTPSFTVTGPGGQLFPTAKMVGGYDFAGDDYFMDGPAPAPDPNPMDCGGHGTHVAGTAAGYGVEDDGSTFTGPYDGTTPFASLRVGPGTAPEADLYALRVFGCNGATDLIVQALDWALDPDGDGDPGDHLDVVNLSIGSHYGSPDDVIGETADAVAAAGVVVVGSAGNAGDATYITGGPGGARRGISVASSTHDTRPWASAFEVTAPAAIAGLYPASESVNFAWDSVGDLWPVTAPLVRPANTTGCEDFDASDAALIAGAIPILDLFPGGGLSPCNSSSRTNRVQAAGGIAAVFVDRPGAEFSTSLAGSSLIPAILVLDVTGTMLLDALDDGPVTVSLSTEYRNQLDTQNGDLISTFSSRGPASAGGGLKPDITAPGDMIDSVAAGTGDEGRFARGTSMASPHVAGIMALLRAAHPTWSVEELKALAMNTAGHDVRRSPGLPPLSPVRQGAGRIDPVAAAAAEVIAFDDEADGEVGVSFGALQVAGTLQLERTVRVVDRGDEGGTFTVGYAPASTVPGAGYSFPDGDTVTVPAGGSATFRVRLDADASALDGTRDPNLSPATLTFGRDGLAEAAGHITLAPAAGTPLRVPLYASLRPASDMAATETELTLTGATDTAQLHLDGDAVDTGAEPPRDLKSLVTPFELQGESAELPGTPIGDLRHTGVSSDARRLLAAGGAFEESRVWFGLTTHDRHSSPATAVYAVEVDADGDGTYESEITNADGVDAFFSGIMFPSLGLVRVGPLQGAYPSSLNPAVFDTDMIILEAQAGWLGLQPGQRFTYRVKSRLRSTELVDTAGPFTFDPSAPGLDIHGPGVADGRLTTWDQPGEVLDVTYDKAAYESDEALGALLLHHYNGDGARAEVVPLADDSETPASAITFPAANAAVPLADFDDGCATVGEDVCGTASDEGSGVEKVEVQLERSADGKFYDGSGWVTAGTWLQASGTTEWTLGFPAVAGAYTIASRATDVAGNVETPATARSFRILPSTVQPTVLYSGSQSIVQGSAAALKGVLSTPEPLVCPVGGKTLSFSLDDDPTTAAMGDGPYALGSAATDGAGVATLSRSTSGWLPGVYTVRVDLEAGGGCLAASDEATLTIAAAGDAANGGGWYTLSGAGRVNFGFTVRKVPGTSTYKGQVLLINNGKWRYKGTLTRYVKPSSTTGAADGTGTLFRWDAATAAWVVHSTGVPLNIRFTDNAKLKKVTDLFGARIAAAASGLPNSDPVPLKGGDVKVG